MRLLVLVPRDESRLLLLAAFERPLPMWCAWGLTIRTWTNTTVIRA